jgi:adenylylsulfate kinase
MIIILTGQPNSGKTTLAYALKEKLSCAGILDGDEIRAILNNKDYSVDGRKRNITTSFLFAKILSNNNITAILALVNPFRELREQLKNDSNFNVKEIYLHSKRFREGKMVDYYEPPLNNYLDIDTDTYSVKQSVTKILDYIK